APWLQRDAPVAVYLAGADHPYPAGCLYHLRHPAVLAAEHAAGGNLQHIHHRSAVHHSAAAGGAGGAAVPLTSDGLVACPVRSPAAEQSVSGELPDRSAEGRATAGASAGGAEHRGRVYRCCSDTLQFGALTGAGGGWGRLLRGAGQL